MYNLVLDNCGCIQKDENIRGEAPPILNLGTVSITLQSLYPSGRNPPPPLIIRVKVVWASETF